MQLYILWLEWDGLLFTYLLTLTFTWKLKVQSLSFILFLSHITTVLRKFLAKDSLFVNMGANMRADKHW